ncbi:MAG TPA: hypothetical protein VFY65_05915 [Longimicrobium sp.]|nr:hypothetical protein [Longimicrobium sp.]
MSRSVELPDSDFERLEEAAAAEGVTPAEWIAGRLPACPEAQPCANGKPAKTLADLFAGRMGPLDLGGAGTSHVLEVPEPVYAAIEEEAGARGLTPLSWVVAQLPAPRTSPTPNGAKPRTMAERLAGRIGRISSGSGEPSSDDVAKSFAEHLEEKQRAGHL